MNPLRPSTFGEYKTLFHLAKEFDKVDVDRDLHITYQELLEMFRLMGIKGTGKTLADTFARKDIEDKGSLSFYQIVELLEELSLMPSVARAAHATDDSVPTPMASGMEEDDDMTDLASLGITPETDEATFLRRLAFYVADAKGTKALSFEAFANAVKLLADFLGIPSGETPTAKDIRSAFDLGISEEDRKGRRVKRLEHKRAKLGFDGYDKVVSRIVAV
eukprot:gnl/Chilomastix_caulleri/448.p1 GENE.gnl/Chilomastix_caulleri/448~~gnl/Chilomastix_caulleri/448.p1  ORF type:complete len:219 (+),score=60.58 gnl/Chilomastix_caulleri/448:169-825(+)